MNPWTSKVADQTTNRCCFFYLCLIFFVGRLEAYLVGKTNRSDRPNMSLLTNLSVTSQWLEYNGKNNISRPTLQIYHTDQFLKTHWLAVLCLSSAGLVGSWNLLLNRTSFFQVRNINTMWIVSKKCYLIQN